MFPRVAEAGTNFVLASHRRRNPALGLQVHSPKALVSDRGTSPAGPFSCVPVYSYLTLAGNAQLQRETGFWNTKTYFRAKRSRFVASADLLSMGRRGIVLPWLVQELEFTAAESLSEPALRGFIEDGKAVEKGDAKFWERVGILWDGMEETGGGGSCCGEADSEDEH